MYIPNIWKLNSTENNGYTSITSSFIDQNQWRIWNVRKEGTHGFGDGSPPVGVLRLSPGRGSGGRSLPKLMLFFVNEYINFDVLKKN